MENESSTVNAMQKGFSLIELMIVVAIIAILATIAMPAYQTFIARSQASEAMLLAGGLKTVVAEAYATTNTCPISGIGPIPSASSVSGKYVSSVSALAAEEGCILRATFREAGISRPLRARTVTFTLINYSGSYHWSCTTDLDQRYAPTSCTTPAE